MIKEKIIVLVLKLIRIPRHLPVHYGVSHFIRNEGGKNMKSPKTEKMRSFKLSLQEESFSYELFLKQTKLINNFIIIPLAFLVILVAWLTMTNIFNLIYSITFAFIEVFVTNHLVIKKIIAMYGLKPELFGRKLYYIPALVILFMIYSGLIRPFL